MYPAVSPLRGSVVLDEVVDPDDVGVVHGGQELPLGHRGRHGVGVAGVEQALEHPPAVADVAVLGQVDPAEPAVGQAAEHLVLAADQISGLQLRGEGERGAAVAAEALGQPGAPVPGAADRAARTWGRTACSRHLRVGEYGAGGVVGGDRRDLHQAGPEVPAGRSGRCCRACRACPGCPLPVPPVPDREPSTSRSPRSARGDRAPGPGPMPRPSRTRCSTRRRWCRRSPAACTGRRGCGHRGCLRPLRARIACW